MTLTKDQVLELIDAGILPKPSRDQIESGQIVNCCGKSENWIVQLGADFESAADCRDAWTAFTLDLVRRAKALPDEECQDALSKIDAEHMHWDWVWKSGAYSGDEYRWFYLIVNGVSEAVCLTYHPKDSVIDGDKVFYIEYIAVAPWNKPHRLVSRRFSGVGSLLISVIQNYFCRKDGYRFGFCLHSLPQAESYYRHIGMQEFPAHGKGELAYFEMEASTAQAFCGGAA